MTTRLASRLDHLERKRQLAAVCSTCRGRGIWVVKYENQAAVEQDMKGCPECGRRNVVTVQYIAPPLPICTRRSHEMPSSQPHHL